MQQWWETLQVSGAVWRHPGDPRAPHVVLRSGLHSDGFIDTLQFLSVTDNLTAAARALSELLNSFLGHESLDWAFGSPMAGIPLATAVAPLIGARHVGFTEKKSDRELICRFEVAPAARVLLIEEMTTTGGTPQRGIDVICKRNPSAAILPVVGAFLIRCSRTPEQLPDAALYPVVDLPALGVTFGEWRPEDCPLCKAESRPIENCKRVWQALLRTMREPSYPVP